jgi:hypothetical protein
MWASETSPIMKIQQLFTDIFTLYQQFEHEGEDLELACGHGLLQWEIGGNKISRHVFIIDSKQPEILQKNIERLNTELQDTKKSIEQIDIRINDAAERETKKSIF